MYCTALPLWHVTKIFLVITVNTAHSKDGPLLRTLIPFPPNNSESLQLSADERDTALLPVWKPPPASFHYSKTITTILKDETSIVLPACLKHSLPMNVCRCLFFFCLKKGFYFPQLDSCYFCCGLTCITKHCVNSVFFQIHLLMGTF